MHFNINSWRNFSLFLRDSNKEILGAEILQIASQMNLNQIVLWIDISPFALFRLVFQKERNLEVRCWRGFRYICKTRIQTVSPLTNIFLRDRLIYGGIWMWASVSTLFAEINCYSSVCTSKEMWKLLNSKKDYSLFRKRKKFDVYIYIWKATLLEWRKVIRSKYREWN